MFVIGVLVIITDQIREEMLGSVVGRISCQSVKFVRSTWHGKNGLTCVCHWCFSDNN